MLKKLLIANRGEIACRIVRTCRRLGVATVAVYADADARSLHTSLADEAQHIGASPATESYLRQDRIIGAAHKAGADAIHPGYGFLAENADFADAVRAAGLVFVGPSGRAMRALGGKAAAKDIAIAAGVPVVPGYQGASQEPATLAAEAERIGYPVMIKAVAGGGGRGMRLVERAADFAEALASARREAAAAFGDDRVLIEKVVVRPRHIEVQVFGDRHGNVVHLFERDCSLQRRNQKVIEEAPAPGMSEGLRARMTAAAVHLAKAVGYEGAGTVEFLVEGGRLTVDAPWYFIEMNTRLQVEHPVTEEITGLDLVEWQLRVAAGEPLPLRQDAITMRGHAVEARLCAEDPAHGFAPGVGRIVAFAAGGSGDPAGPGAGIGTTEPGVRIEQGFRAGDTISPFYDSLIAKLITFGATRDEALLRLEQVLRETVVAGPRVNTPFLLRLVQHGDVAAGSMDTGLIARDLDALSRRRVSATEIEHAVAVLMTPPVSAFGTGGCDPWATADAFQISGDRVLRRPFAIDGVNTPFEIAWSRDGLAPTARMGGGATGTDAATRRSARLVPDGDGLFAIIEGEQVEIRLPHYDVEAVAEAGGGTIRAPITGRVARLFVSAGERVVAGSRIAVIEAMKMEHVLQAPAAGLVEKLGASEGEQVTQGALIASLTLDA